MSNIEHLIENALTAISKNPNNAYQAFVEEMSGMYNQQMLKEVSVTEEELWAIAQYIVYTWMHNMGWWIYKPYENDEAVWLYHCSECNAVSASAWNFCRECGAKMHELNDKFDGAKTITVPKWRYDNATD